MAGAPPERHPGAESHDLVTVEVPRRDLARAGDSLPDAELDRIGVGREAAGEDGEERAEPEPSAEASPPAGAVLPAVASARPSGAAGLWPAPRSRGGLWLEVLIVLCLTAFPQLAYSLHDYLRAGAARPLTLSEDVISTFSYLLSVVVAVAYLMARSGERARVFGFARPLVMVDLLAGVVAFLAALLLGTAAASGVKSLGCSELPLPFPRIPADSGSGALLLTTTIVLEAFGEEVVWRGYLVTRLGQLLGSVAGSLAAASVLFGAVHLYQGLPGAAMALVCGLVFGLMFCLTGRLWASSLAHAAWNLVAAAGNG